MNDLLTRLSPDNLDLKGQIAAVFFANPFLVANDVDLQVRFGDHPSQLDAVLSDLCAVGMLCRANDQIALSTTCADYPSLAQWCLGMRGDDAALRQQVVAHASLVKLQQALAVSQEEVATILDIVPAGVVLIDRYGQMLKTNALAQDILHLPVGDQNFSICERLGLCLEVALADPIDREVDGSPPLSVTSRPFSHVGHEGGAVIVVQDISGRREIEAQASRVREEFFSMIRHELRKPLLTVERCLAQAEVTGEALDLARAATSHLGTMVDDMLLLARLERDPMSVFGHDAVSLRFLIAGADLAYRTPARQAGIALRVVQPDRDTVFAGDAARLSQVIGNLLDNAIKFTPRQGHVTLSGGERDGEVWVSVADTGPGIPPSEHPRIFDKFYQVAGGPGRQPGLGLGLAICHHIVDALGGQIDIDAHAEEGARFVVRIPLRKPEV